MAGKTMTTRMAAFFGGPWDRRERRVPVPEPPDVYVPIPPEPAPLSESEVPELLHRVARYERRPSESGGNRVWVYVCVDDGRSLPRWTIAVITAWDGEEGDELFENVASVSARTEADAVRIYGEQHPHDRDYNFVYARPFGTPW